MNATENMRKAFDDCTVMAGVENDFECVYITKDAALSYLADIEEENAKMKDLIEYMYRCFVIGHDWGPYCACETEHVEDQMRELGVE